MASDCRDKRKQLAQMLVDGNELVWEEIIRDVVPKIRTYIKGRFRLRPEEIEDIVADGMCSLWSSRHSFDPSRASIGAFLGVICRHIALDRLRDIYRETTVLSKDLDEIASPGWRQIPEVFEEAVRSPEYLDRMHRLKNWLKSLPDWKQAVALHRCYADAVGVLSHLKPSMNEKYFRVCRCRLLQQARIAVEW